MGTINYYDTHADEFVAGTLCADMGAHYKKFEALMPAHAAVMDCGCGSGRDTLHFLARGYEVVPLDGSSKLARRATELTGRYFTDLTEEGLARIVAQVPDLRIRETWVTSDVRPGRNAEKWLNALIVK